MRGLISLISVAVVFMFSISVTAQEPVLYFPFEGTGNEVVDESGNGNDGEFDAGNANRVAGKDANFGMAMEFDGESRIAVEESDTLAIDTPISFVMWVKKADEGGGTGTLPRIISRSGDQHELAIDNGHLQLGNFDIYFGANPGWTTCMPVDLDWHHIALTYDGDEFIVYLDGENAFDLAAAGARTFTGTLYIGSRHDLSTAEFYMGLLDELAIFPVALTHEQVVEIMTGGVTGELLAVSPHSKLGSTWGAIKANYLELQTPRK